MTRATLGVLAGLVLCAVVCAQGPATPTPLQQLAAQAAASPRDANLQYRLGRAWEAAGNPQAAIRAYFQAQLVGPADAKVLAALARTYARVGEYERAAFWYRKLLLLRPGDEKLSLEAARLALRYNQPLQAEGLLKQALRYHPDALDAWVVLGQTYETLKLLTEALACYEQVVDLRTPSLGDRRHLVDLYLRTGQPAKALGQIRAALRSRPKDRDLLVMLGDCQMALKSPAAAADAYEQAANLAPRQPEYRLKLAEALSAAGDGAAALEEYRQVCDLAQPNAELLLRVASLAARHGDEATAQHYLALLVALLPQETAHREALVQAAVSRGDQATAVTQYRELQATGNLDAYLSEADVARALGGREWALQRLRLLVPQLGPRPDLAARVALVLVALGETLEATNLAARVTVQPGVALPDKVLAARALAQAGENTRAERLLRAVLASDPRNPGAILGLAQVLQRREEWGESYDLLRGGLAANPKDDELALALVNAADRTKNLQALTTLLRRMVETDPRNEVALNAWTYALRLRGGKAFAAQETVALAVGRPNEKLWSLVAARELAAAGRGREAAATYETLVHDLDYGAPARVGLCEVLLADQRYGDLLETLARLAGPGQVGSEGFTLLGGSRPQPQLQRAGAPATDLEPQAHAAAMLYLAAPGSEDYYLALADLALTMHSGDVAVAWLQERVISPGKPAPSAAGLLRLQRSLGRPAVGLEWLNKLHPEPLSPRARLEEIHCLLATSRTAEALVKAEGLLPLAPAPVRAETHYLCGEALVDSYRPEEAIWHYVRALAEGYAPESIMPHLRSLIAGAPIAPSVTVNALQELWSAGLTDLALALAEAAAPRPDFGAVRQWALFHARELRLNP